MKYRSYSKCYVGHEYPQPARHFRMYKKHKFSGTLTDPYLHYTDITPNYYADTLNSLQDEVK